MSYELDENYFMSRKLVEFRTAVIGELDAASFVGAVDAAPGGVIQTRDAPVVRGINECPVCSKGFSSTSTLNRHWRDFHTVHDRSKGSANVVFVDDAKRMLRYDVNGVSVCDSTAACSVSPTDQGSQTSGQLCNRQCSVCLKMFSSTSTLNRHRRDFHGDQHRFRSSEQGSEATPNDVDTVSVCHSATCNGGGLDQSCSFCDRQCAICLKTFSSSSTLNRHRREIHGDHSEKKGSAARCSECHRTLCNRAAFIRHLTVSHPEIAVEREELMFNSESAFDAWKTKMEADTESTFLKQDGAKRGKDGIVIHYYTCHQSGGGDCVGANQKSRKSTIALRTISSVGFFCPAHIVARTCANRWVSVMHVSTHVGHQQQHHQHVGRHRSNNNNNNGHHHHHQQHHKLKHPDHEQTSDDRFQTRKQHLSDLLKGLFPVVDECNTERELDAFDGILKLVRPVLATIRTSDDHQDGELPFAKQVLDVLCPLGIGRAWRPIEMKLEKRSAGQIGVDDEDDSANPNSTNSGFLEQ